MNSVPTKYKSLFYSLSIHLFLAVALLFAYMKEDKEHEVHTLVHLSAIHFSSPAVQVTPTAKLKKPSVKKAQKTPLQAQIKKKEVPKKLETLLKSAPAKTLEVAKLTPVKKEIKTQKKQEEIREKSISVNEEVATRQEELAQTLVSAEPKIDYEAQYMEDNIALINALIRKNLFYPRLARKRGLQGKTMVSFTLNEKGEVISIEAMGIVSSVLKKSAIKTVKKASTSFPHPKVTLALRIPIVYKLN